MTATKCSCGFEELPDERLIDHLLEVFEPADAIGNDGEVHQETSRLRCSCGAVSTTGESLDEHLLQVFTPGDAVGRDGRRHGVR
jgi:hypothetical protein